MSNSTISPIAPSPSVSAIATSAPPTYIIATAIIVSILLIFVLIGFWIYFSTSKDITPPSHPSRSRYTTRPSSTSSTNTLPGWLRDIARKSPTLPLFKQNENDLALLREVLWSHPEDDYKPAKRRSAPTLHKQRPLTSHPVTPQENLTTRSSTCPASPANAYISSNKKQSLLARRHIRASKQPLALALPAITEKQRPKFKGKKWTKSSTPSIILSKAHLRISSPKLPQNVADRLAQRYQLFSPLRQQPVDANVATAAFRSSSNSNSPGLPDISEYAAKSKSIPDAAASTTTSIVLSPTIARRRMLTSGPTEGDVIADLKSPYIYTPDFVPTPGPASSTGLGKVYTPYRAGSGASGTMGGIDSIVVGGGEKSVVEQYKGREGVLSPKLPHPGNKWVGSL